jgi:hypothetical protein
MPLLYRFTAALALMFSLAGIAHAQSASFAAPSGNILCFTETYDYVKNEEIYPESQPLVCLVFQANWTLPEYYGYGESTCDLERTRTIIVPPSGPAQARWTCHGDMFWPYPTPKISYGSDWSVANHSCTMRKDGVRCQNATGHGFHVRRAKLTLN